MTISDPVDRRALDRRRRLADISVAELAKQSHIPEGKLWAFLRSDLNEAEMRLLEHALKAAEAEGRL
jgi:hypothetical protein